MYELLALYHDIDIKLSSRIKQNPSSSTTTLDLPSHAFEASAARSSIFRASANLCTPSASPHRYTNHLQRIEHSFRAPIELHLAYTPPFDAILPLSSHILASLNNLSPNPFSDGFEVKNMVPSTNVLQDRLNTFWDSLM
jgi:hypothetical protein